MNHRSNEFSISTTSDGYIEISSSIKKEEFESSLACTIYIDPADAVTIAGLILEAKAALVAASNKNKA